MSWDEAFADRYDELEQARARAAEARVRIHGEHQDLPVPCLLYTSDAADE